MRRILIGRVLLGLAAAYLTASAGLYLAMRQPPERFGAIMSHVPLPAMMILPFQPLWMLARAGSLGVNTPAPDFTLPTLDHRAEVTLSGQWRQRPVVLVFGSYT